MESLTILKVGTTPITWNSMIMDVEVNLQVGAETNVHAIPPKSRMTSVETTRSMLVYTLGEIEVMGQQEIVMKPKATIQPELM